jgi:hypothetical protein
MQLNLLTNLNQLKWIILAFFYKELQLYIQIVMRAPFSRAIAS